MNHLRRGPALATAALAALATAAVPVVAQASPASSAAVAAVTAPGDATGTYYQLTPTRLLDTRSGNGAPKAKVGEDRKVDLQVTGRGGVPSTGVAAAVLNVTGISPTRGTFLTVYPEGTALPTASTVNLAAAAIRANLVTVPVSSSGKVSIYNSLGTIDVAADVLGFYSKDDSMQPTQGSGAQFQLAVPGRLFDSREDGFPLAPYEAVGMGPDFGDPDLNTRIRALAVNVTALNAKKVGYLQAYAGDAGPSPTSALNLVPGKVVANMAIIQASYDAQAKVPAITIRNHSSGTVDVLVDVVGYYDQGSATGLHYRAISPVRIVDTRTGVGGTKGAMGAKTTYPFVATSAVADSDTFALVANTTAVRPSAYTWLTVWDGTTPVPKISNINPSAGDVVANATITPLSDANSFSVFNQAGLTNVVMDVTGSFQFHTQGAAANASSTLRSGATDRLSASTQLQKAGAPHAFRAVALR